MSSQKPADQSSHLVRILQSREMHGVQYVDLRLRRISKIRKSTRSWNARRAVIELSIGAMTGAV